MSRNAAAARHSIRETGRFTSQANLREAQKKLLAPSSRWRKEWVKPGAASGAQSSYKIMKWVKYDEGGETAADSEQPTEEQVTAAITGARTLLEPPGSNAGTPAPAGTPAASGAQSSSSMPNTIPGNTPSAPSPAAASQPQPQPASAIPESAAPEVKAEQPQETIPVQTEQQAVTRTPQEQVAEEASLVPGKQDEGGNMEDEGGNMEVEQEQREHDVRMAPELVGKEGEEMRAVLGISDPVQGGPPEVRD